MNSYRCTCSPNRFNSELILNTNQALKSECFLLMQLEIELFKRFVRIEVISRSHDHLHEHHSRGLLTLLHTWSIAEAYFTARLYIKSSHACVASVLFLVTLYHSLVLQGSPTMTTDTSCACGFV